MISDVEYYKVFYYMGKEAKVYFVEGNIRAGHFLWLEKENKEWKVKKWEAVWSDVGSASGITFPFYR